MHVLVLLVLVTGSEALLLSMADEALHPQLVHSVNDVPEVFTGDIAIFRQRVGEVCHDAHVSVDLSEDLLDRQLLILGHRHSLHVLQWHQLLLACEDGLDEVAVDHVLGWHVELQRFAEVLEDAAALSVSGLTVLTHPY